MNEITCNQDKKKKKSNFRNQLDGAKIQGNIFTEKKKKKRKLHLIYHLKPNHSVWTQQRQVIFP